MRQLHRRKGIQELNVWQDYYERRDADGSWVKWPDEQVIRFVYRNRGAIFDGEKPRALDVGCGSGRHTLFMAAEGFDAHGTDYSEKAVEVTNRQLESAGHAAAARVAPVDRLPYDNDFFDIVVCWHTLYCNTLAVIRAGAAEMRRVLKPGGRACVSLRRDNDYTRGRGAEIEPGTFRLDPEQVHEDPPDMTVHYSSLHEARDLFSNFSNVEIGFADFAFGNLDEVRAHWIVIATK